MAKSKKEIEYTSVKNRLSRLKWAVFKIAEAVENGTWKNLQQDIVDVINKKHNE